MALTHSIRIEEYESQLYSFSCKDLFEYVKGIILQAIQSEFQELQPYLLGRQKTEEGRTAAVDAISGAIKKCFALSEEPLNVILSMMNSALCIPAHVLLPEDEIQRRAFTEKDEETEKTSLIKLQSRMRRARYLKTTYEEEIRMLRQVKDKMKLCCDICSKVDSVERQLSQDSALSNKFHQLIQNLLGLEVRRASLQLGGHSWTNYDLFQRNSYIENHNNNINNKRKR